MKTKMIRELVSGRRAVFPRYFTDEAVSSGEIEFILEMANLAPTHKLTEPWRFKVVQGRALDRLGVFMAEHYRRSVSSESFSQLKYNKPIKKCERSQAIILICLLRSPEEIIPEWEELAAVSCAVQNLWISAGALGLGGYWSSSDVIHSIGQFTPLEDREKCVGLFYLGHHNMPEIERKRGDWQKKVEWIQE